MHGSDEQRLARFVDAVLGPTDEDDRWAPLVLAAFESLPPGRHRDVLAMRYGLDGHAHMTFRAIGDVAVVSSVRIQKSHKDALRDVYRAFQDVRRQRATALRGEG